MKKITFFLVFFLICLFLVIPPLIPADTTENSLNFSISWLKIALFVLAVMIFWYFEFSGRKYTVNKISILFASGKVFLYFGMLIAVNVIISSVTYMLTKDISFKIDFNASPSGLIHAFINFFISAFYEEALYRLYLPCCVNELFINIFCKENKNNSETQLYRKKIIQIFVEIICILIFAFSHINSGYNAVINALISGTILRIAVLKNKTILIGCISHFLYNSFIFLAAILL